MGWLMPALLIVVAVSHWSVSAEPQAQLVGCHRPDTVAQRISELALTEKDWRSLNPERIRSAWPVLLNQVDCPGRRSGLYLLASFDRVISDESHCGTTFAIKFDEQAVEHRLTNVNVYHSGGAFADVMGAADLFAARWRPSPGVEIEEYGRNDWNRAKQHRTQGKTTIRWHATVGGCSVSFQIEKSIFRSSSGWTTRVSLAQDPECERNADADTRTARSR